MALNSLLTIIISFAVLLCKVAAEGVVPAIYVFGDSTADVGNNNYIEGMSIILKANHPHNGIDYPGGIPTGRCTNGYNGIDFLGFKESPPAFLSLKTETEKLNGVNFASAGSGILDSTGETTINFSQQVINFKEVTDIVAQNKGKEAQLLLSKSLYLISVGTNDLFMCEHCFSESASQSSNENYVSSLVLQFENHLRNLYKLGARKFGVIGVYHLGCTPALRMSPSAECDEPHNLLARLFNQAVEARLEALSPTLEGLKYSYIHSYDFMSLALATPANFGFEEIKAACCGLGNLNGESECMPNANVCSNRKNYLFWDMIHPAQETYRQLATEAFNGSRRLATPISIKQLAAY